MLPIRRGLISDGSCFVPIRRAPNSDGCYFFLLIWRGFNSEGFCFFPNWRGYCFAKLLRSLSANSEASKKVFSKNVTKNKTICD